MDAEHQDLLSAAAKRIALEETGESLGHGERETDESDDESADSQSASDGASGDEAEEEFPGIFPFLYDDISVSDAIKQLRAEFQLNQNNREVRKDAEWCLLILRASDAQFAALTEVDNSGLTALEVHSCLRRRRALIRCAELRRNKPPNVPISEDQKEFLDAVRRGDLQNLNRILDDYYEGRIAIDINGRGQGENFGHTALSLACGLGHVDVLRRLLAVGVDVNARIPYDAAPL